MLNTGQHIKDYHSRPQKSSAMALPNTHRLRNTMSTPPLYSIDLVFGCQILRLSAAPLTVKIGRATPHKIKLDLLYARKYILNTP